MTCPSGRPVLAIAAALVLALAAACGSNDDEGGLPTATIVVSSDDGDRAELTVEVARSAAERSRGLSFRESLPQGRGMLFVFPQDTGAAFWMKDTSIPLSVAFIRADGTILGIQDMEPFSTELHRPPAPYRFALEVNQGWFAEHGFAPGDRVEISDAVRAPAAGE